MKFNDIVYKQPDIEIFEADFKVTLQKIKSAKSFDKQNAAFLELYKIRDNYDTMYQLANIRFKTNTANKEYQKQVAYLDEISPRVENLINQFYLSLNDLEFKSELSKKWGDYIFNKAKFLADGFNPIIMDDLEEHNKLVTQYTHLKATAKIPFKGEKLNLGRIRKYFFDNDRATRENANKAYWSFFSENQEKFDDLFDKQVKIRHKMAQKMGYDNFVELGYKWMNRIDYTEEMVSKFRQEVVDKIVPITRKLRQQQKERLGYDHLEYYDLKFHFNSGNPNPKGNYESIIAHTKKMYEELSSETAGFFNYLMEYDLLDLKSRQGKNDGGFCWALSNFKHPFIFANFNGTSDDIRVLTHEAGHAFQYFKSRDYDIIEHRNPSSESAEIHAMSMEFLTYPWMEGFFKEDTEKYLFSHLNSSILFIPYGCAIDHFQHIIYKNPDFTPDQRAETWKEMEALYLPDRKMNFTPYLNSGRVWQSIMHIYQRPFYSIDYVLAQICAFQFWQKAKDNRAEAINDYVHLSKAGGTLPFLDLVKLANLESPFEEGVMQKVTSNLVNHLDKIDDQQF